MDKNEIMNIKLSALLQSLKKRENSDHYISKTLSGSVIPKAPRVPRNVSSQLLISRTGTRINKRLIGLQNFGGSHKTINSSVSFRPSAILIAPEF